MKIYLEIVKSKLPTNKSRIDSLVNDFGWLHIRVDVSRPTSYLNCLYLLGKSFLHGKIYILSRMPALPIPVLLFFFFLPNLSLEHHAIFEAERNNSSKFRYLYSKLTLFLFRILCRYKIQHNICFSKEIANHVVSHYNARSNSIYSTVNSFDPIPVLSDTRNDSCYTFTFMCGKFYPWQGLDLCLSFVNKLSSYIPIKLNLIGQLTVDQHDMIKDISYITYHGYLTECEIDKVLSETDIGLAPFALDRQGFSESSALKTAYYLSRGVSVLSYFKDSRSLSEPFFYVCKPPDSSSLSQILNFVRMAKSYSRYYIYSSSVDFWSHSSILFDLDLLFK